MNASTSSHAPSLPNHQSYPPAALPLRLSDQHPWRTLAPGVDWDSPLLYRPLHLLFEHAAKAFAELPYLSFFGRRWTYAQSAAIINKAALGLQQLGVKPGVRVALCLPNTPYATWAYFAILKAGGTVVPLNAQQNDHELFQQLNDCDCRVLITLNLNHMQPRLSALAPPSVKTLISCSMSDILPPLRRLLQDTMQRSQLSPVPKDARHLSWSEMLAPDSELEKFAPPTIEPQHDLAVILHTTGGSGSLPKAVMLSHASLSANTEQLRRWFHTFKPGEERFLAVLPFFHSLGMTAVQNLATVLGAELVLLARFDVDQCLRTISKTRPSVLVGIPAILTALSTCHELEAYSLASLRYVISGGAPLPQSTRAILENLSGCRVIEGYGLSEAGPVTHCTPIQGHARTGSVGLPLPGTSAMVCALGQDHPQPLPAGSLGELWIKAPQVMSGYWHRPADTRAILKDGWLKTGDVVKQDEDGYLHIIGRNADAFHVFDGIFYPQQIEKALLQHPMVSEAVCIASPSTCEDPRPVCFVSLREPQAWDDAETLPELREFLQQSLPHSVLPQTIEVWEHLPRNENHKISRSALRNYLKDQEGSLIR